MTWYRRGRPYWARRVRLTLMWGFVLFLLGLIDVGFISAMRPSSRSAFLVVEAIVTVVVLASFAVRMARRWNVATLPAPYRPIFSYSVGRGRSGAILTGFLQLGLILVVLVAAFASMIFPALFIAMFLTSLMPEPLSERQARLWMAELSHDRGDRTRPGR
jgi:hypothetical protein